MTLSGLVKAVTSMVEVPLVPVLLLSCIQGKLDLISHESELVVMEKSAVPPSSGNSIFSFETDTEIRSSFSHPLKAKKANTNVNLTKIRNIKGIGMVLWKIGLPGTLRQI
jgi:hypothetical protein